MAVNSTSRRAPGRPLAGAAGEHGAEQLGRLGVRRAVHGRLRRSRSSRRSSTRSTSACSASSSSAATRSSGFDNYRSRCSATRSSGTSLGRVLLFLAVQVPIMLVLALVAALALDSARLHGRRFFRIAIFLPYAVPAVVAVAHVGLHLRRPVRPRRRASTTRSAAALPTRSARNWILASIGNIVTWEFVGYNMLIFYAALRVDPDRALRGGGDRRRRRVPHGLPRIKLPALRGRDRDRDDLLDHRQLPAVQRAEHPAAAGARTSSPATSRRTCTPTTCRSPASSTTTRRRSRSSWASSPRSSPTSCSCAARRRTAERRPSPATGRRAQRADAAPPAGARAGPRRGSGPRRGRKSALRLLTS